MPSLGHIIFATIALLFTLVSSTPLAQGIEGAPVPLEIPIPKNLTYDGVDDVPLPNPSPTATPTPSPRFNAPVKIASVI